MKTNNLLVLIAVLVFAAVAVGSVSAVTKFTGTIVSYVEQVQGYPEAINQALCDHDLDAFHAKLGELANTIQAANDAIQMAGIPNSLNLWAVYGEIVANPNCGVHDAALARADWSREESTALATAGGCLNRAVAD